MTTENQDQPPVSPNPASSLPQQEKRWTITGKEDEYADIWCGGKRIAMSIGPHTAQLICDAHNATLSAPKPEERKPELCQSCMIQVHSEEHCPRCHFKFLDLGIPDAFTNYVGAVLQKTREVVTLWQGRVHQREISEQTIKISKAVEELSVLVGDGERADRVSFPNSSAVAPSVVAGVEEKECQVSPISSRVCERGTKGCEVDHLTLGEPRGELAAVHVLQKIRELLTLWTQRRGNINESYLGTFEYRAGLIDATGDCQTDLEKLLSSQGVGEHAMGVSSDEKEWVAGIIQKSLLEPKELEEEEHD